jgi:hypothetical protein
MPFVRMRMGDVVWQLPEHITALITGEKFFNKVLTILFCV